MIVYAIIYRSQKNENVILEKKTSNQYSTMIWCKFLVFFMCKIPAVKQTVCLLALEMHVLPHAVTSSGTFSPPAHMDCLNEQTLEVMPNIKWQVSLHFISSLRVPITIQPRFTSPNSNKFISFTYHIPFLNDIPGSEISLIIYLILASCEIISLIAVNL